MKKIWEGARFPLGCFAVAMVLLWAGDAIDRLFGNTAIALTLTLWMLSAVPFAVSFYRMRRRNRLAYGLFEMAAACALFYVTMLNILHRGVTIPMSFELIASRTVVFIAVIYVMVRALDNIGEGLKPYPIWEARWDKVFPKPE